MKREQAKNAVKFYPIPSSASLIISTDEKTATAEELVSVAMHLSLDKPGCKVQYWIRIEGD